MNPKVSIIVTTKNRPDYLFRCLLSIKMQTFQDYECIIVGDNCRHGYSVYEEFWKDKRFCYFNMIEPTPKNCGAIGKNIGIEIATASLICYCNDDDHFLPDHVQDLYDMITNYSKELAYSKFYHVDFGNASTYEILDRDILFDPANTKFPMSLQIYDTISMIHTKAAAKAVGFWKPWVEVGYNEDRYFINRLQSLLNDDFIISDKLTAVYNAHWMDQDNKEHDEYVNGLKNLPAGQIYMYPELVNNLKSKYAKFI